MNNRSVKINKKCSDRKDSGFQKISKNLISNITLSSLEKKLKNYLNDRIYFYIIRTVNFDKQEKIFEQRGIGPNLEGNLISLCTCKHYMRTFPNVKEGTWIAGITDVTAGPDYGTKVIKGNYLFYLFQIDKTFDSQFDYYEYIKNKDETFISKSSLQNRLGDVYIPVKKLAGDEKYNPDFYKEPLKDHIHFRKNNWHYDIKKVSRNFKGNIIETNHKLLLGGNANSFVWEKPLIKLSEGNRIGEGQRTSTIKEFLTLLKTE